MLQFPDCSRCLRWENFQTWYRRGLAAVASSQENILTSIVHIDHDDIITPSLPSDVKIPTPFLPTDDRRTKDLYWAAIAAYLAEVAKPPEQKDHELKQKWTDVQNFNEKTLCYYSTHAFNFRCANKQDAKERRLKPNNFRKKYHKLKNKLINEMRVEGLVNFGRELTAYLNETGMVIEEPAWYPVPERKNETGSLRR